MGSLGSDTCWMRSFKPLASRTGRPMASDRVAVTVAPAQSAALGTGAGTPEVSTQLLGALLSLRGNWKSTLELRTDVLLSHNIEACYGSFDSSSAPDLDSAVRRGEERMDFSLVGDDDGGRRVSLAVGFAQTSLPATETMKCFASASSPSNPIWAFLIRPQGCPVTPTFTPPASATSRECSSIRMLEKT